MKKSLPFRRICARFLLCVLLLQQLPLAAVSYAQAPLPAPGPAVTTEAPEEGPSSQRSAMAQLRTVLPALSDPELASVAELMATHPQQKYILHLSFHYDDPGQNSAASFQSFSYAKDSPIDLPLPNVYNLTPATVPSGYIVPPDDPSADNAAYRFRVGEDWTQFLQDFPAVSSGGFQIISVSVSYTAKGTFYYRVEHLLEQADGTYAPALDSQGAPLVDLGSVTDTLLLSLRESPAGNRVFTGYQMTPSSAQQVKRTFIAPNVDPASLSPENIIKLYYTRKTRRVDYATCGGTQFDIRIAHYHDALADYIPAEDPIRPGYRFMGWYTNRSPITPARPEGSENQFVWSDPVTPDQLIEDDTTLLAKWEPIVPQNEEEARSVKLAYWMQDPDQPDSYYSIGNEMVNRDANGRFLQADDVFDDSPYHDLADLRARGKVRLPDDPQYFHFNPEMTAQAAAGNRYVQGNNSQVINIYFDRNEYTLIFHLGQAKPYRVATGFAPNGSNWISRHTWEYVDFIFSQPPTLTMQGTKYYITNNDRDCYTITARYGQSIAALWPTQISSSLLKDFAGWSTEKRDPDNPDSFIGIIGTHSTMDELLVPSPKADSDTGNAGTVHHLVAIFSYNWTTTPRIYHYFEETTASDPNSKPSSIYTDGCKPFPAKITNPDGSIAGSTDLTVPTIPVTEFHTVRGEGKGGIEEKPVASFPYRRLVFASHKTVGSTQHIYYVYQHTTHNLTLDHNLSSQISSQQHISYTKLDHREKFAQIHAPAPRPGYQFKGWYLDPGGHEPVCPPNQSDPSKWIIGKLNYNIPENNTTLYAKWVRDPVSVTLYMDNDSFTPAQMADLDRAIQNANARLTAEIKLEHFPNIGPEGTYHKYVLTGLPYNQRFPDEIWEVIKDGPDENPLLSYPKYPPGSWHLVDPNEINSASRRLCDPSVDLVHDCYLVCVPEQNMNGRIKLVYQDEQGRPLSRDPADPSHTWDLVYERIDGIPVLSNTQGDFPIKKYPVGLKMQPIPAPHVPGYVPTQRNVSGVVIKAPDLSHSPTPEADPTVVIMTYTQAAALTYTIHHVLVQNDSQGNPIDYGNSQPPADVVELTEPVTTTLSGSAIGTVTAHFDSTLIGYTVLGEQVKSMLLTADPDQNHLYFYYTCNSDAPYTIHFYLGDAVDNHYPNAPSASFHGVRPSGSILEAAQLLAEPRLFLQEAAAQQDRFTLESLITVLDQGNYELDPDKSAASQLFVGSNTEQNVLNLYLRRIPWAYFYIRNGTWPQDAPPISGLAPDQYAYLYDTSTDDPKLIGCRIRCEIGKPLPAPIAPTPPQLADKITEYTFLGWTETSPDTVPSPPYITEGHADVLKDRFDREFKYSFTQPVTQYTTVLYAVYDPRLTYFSLVKLDQESGQPLGPDAGLVFTLRRLVAERAGGGWRPSRDPTGEYVVDTNFPPQTEHGVWQEGKLRFPALAAGFYQVTETTPPEGYHGLDETIVVYVDPTTMEASLYAPKGSSAVQASTENNHLVLTIGNRYIYHVTMDAPTALNFTYTSDALVWDPVGMTYVQKPETSGHWTAHNPDVTVTNRSDGLPLTMTVMTRLDPGVTGLTTTLTAKLPNGVVQSAAGSNPLVVQLNTTAAITLAIDGSPSVLSLGQTAAIGQLLFSFQPRAVIHSPAPSGPGP